MVIIESPPQAEILIGVENLNEAYDRLWAAYYDISMLEVGALSITEQVKTDQEIAPLTKLKGEVTTLLGQIRDGRRVIYDGEMGAVKKLMELAKLLQARLKMARPDITYRKM